MVSRGSRGGAVVAQWWEHSSHQCGPGSIHGPGVICGWSLLVVLSLLWEVFSAYSGFPLRSSKTNTAKFQFDPESMDTCWKCSWVLLRCSVGKQIRCPFPSNGNSKNSETHGQMGFEPTTLRDLVGCSNHWATGDSVVSKGEMWV